MPAEADIVLAKIETIDRCLRRIRDVTGGDPASLRDQDREDIFVLNMQRAVQATIDLANHLVASEALPLPATLGESFVLLERHAELSSDLAARMRSMVGFRNIVVHDYQALDPAILAAILERNLPDLTRFAQYALDRAGLAQGGVSDS